MLSQLPTGKGLHVESHFLRQCHVLQLGTYAFLPPAQVVPPCNYSTFSKECGFPRVGAEDSSCDAIPLTLFWLFFFIPYHQQ